MRFTVELTLKGNPPFLIQAEYRKGITSMIKEAFKSIEGGEKYFFNYWGNRSENKAKPYTFSLFLPKPRLVINNGNGFLEFNENKLNLNFTSSDNDFLVLLYKGLLQINTKYTPFGTPVEFTNIYIKKDDYIIDDIARFKILSPIVVRDIMVIGYNKRFKGYLSVGSEKYTDALGHSVKNLCKQFLPKGSKEIKKSDIKIDTSDCFGVRVNHYSEVIPGTKGVIEIKADKNILKLIYDAGIGARRSQGFGMLELDNKTSYDRVQENYTANAV
ncbi:MAG: CRISPR-associated endoribonuclease Cas6 [Spirochaetes bacterium]|nr:CRISPR-associated endoribonuclease Cas6 [Spirochaetota bacterium]